MHLDPSSKNNRSEFLEGTNGDMEEDDDAPAFDAFSPLVNSPATKNNLEVDSETQENTGRDPAAEGVSFRSLKLVLAHLPIWLRRDFQKTAVATNSTNFLAPQFMKLRS